MISDIEINNFKSIKSAKIELGKVNILIGENGAGKSNLLEAIALASASTMKKLDNEFLVSRGIRVLAPKLMRSALSGVTQKNIEIKIKDSSGEYAELELSIDDSPYPKWKSHTQISRGHITGTDAVDIIQNAAMSFIKRSDIKSDVIISELRKLANKFDNLAKDAENTNNVTTYTSKKGSSILEDFISEYVAETSIVAKSISDFIIFSPENSALRDFSKEGQILPLGLSGEGVIKLLEVMLDSNPEFETALKKFLSMFGWFKGIKFISGGANPSDPYSVEVNDKYIKKRSVRLDLHGTNEGFLFLIFYFCLLSSKITPHFFAIDNIDASLNPKLCSKLTEEICRLASKHEKQVILTTHNPAILDGLNLEDDNNRLFVVSRNDEDGSTQIRRVFKPKRLEGAPPIRLSEAFLRGSLGGLPKGF